MDQIKIGKFIATLRKEKELTQSQLGNLIGVTDRAVSKWENGRGLPDLSLIKPLCEALDISVNDLLNGEIVQNEELIVKTEENIIETLEYSAKKVKNIKKIYFFVILSLVCAFSLLITSFFIDVGRMKNNEPVIFSTWGFDYAPPVDLTDYKIELAIKDYLIEKWDNEEHHEEGVKTFVSLKTYLIEESTDGVYNFYNAYVWVYSEQCYLENNDVMNYSSFSVPYKFTLKEDKSYLPNEYIIEKAEFPRDAHYSEDMKTLFPKSVQRDMDLFHIDGSVDKLQNEINEQIKLYFRQ